MPEPATETTPPQEAPPLPPPPAPPVIAAPAQAATGDEGGKTVELKTSDIGKIKNEARDKGRREALSELEQHAVSAGFASLSDAFKAIGDLNKKSQAQPPKPPQENAMATTTPPPKKKPPVTVDRAAQEAARVADVDQKRKDQWRNDRKARRRLEREVEAKDAEIALRGQIYSHGVVGKNVDYMLHQLRLDMRGKSVEELAKYDVKAFIENFRKDQPYLFGETVQPATTGTNGATPETGTPPPPAPGAPTVDNAINMQFDARTAKPEQVQEYMKKLGIDPSRMA